MTTYADSVAERTSADAPGCAHSNRGTQWTVALRGATMVGRPAAGRPGAGTDRGVPSGSPDGHGFGLHPSVGPART